MPQDLPVILHNDKRGLLTVEDDRLDVVYITSVDDEDVHVLIISAESTSFVSNPQYSTCRIWPSRSRQEYELRLSKMHVLVEPSNMADAQSWVELAMKTAYPHTKPFRRVLLLVNPVGGKGKAKSIVREQVIPTLEAAGCVVEVRETTHRLHAKEIASSIDLDYDVISPVSGDGLIFEVYNGLAMRADARTALKMPIGPIPTGSANSMCINLFGPKDVFNIQLACLNVIKGISTPKDLFSILLLPSRQRVWSFLALATGLMVDLDIGTEHLRWMGDLRFTLGFIKGVGLNRNHKCRLRMRVVAEDKIEMARKSREWAKKILAQTEKPLGGGIDPALKGKNRDLPIKNGGPSLEYDQSVHGREANGTPTDGSEGHSAEADSDLTGRMPEHQMIEPDETWMTIESGNKASTLIKEQRDAKAARTGQSGGWIDGEGILYVYAGSMPWIARDLMQWPVAVQGSGAFDIVIQSIAPRATVLSAITGAAKGEQFWLDPQHYYKIDALVVENLDREHQKIWAIDGEAYPYDAFSVELHTGAARVLTLDGHLHIPEFMKRHDKF